MRVVFMGTPQFAVESLIQLVQAGHQVLGVVTQPDRPKGRGKKLALPPVKEKALELGLPVYQPSKVKEVSFLKKLEFMKPEVIVVVAFGQILPKDILELPSFGCVNVHASLLPKYRGAAPIHWAIINGEKETGITTMWMDEGLDTGNMLLKARVPIGPNITTGELHDQLAVLGGRILLETLDKLEKKQLFSEPQNNDQATYAPLLKKEHEKILWKRSAQNIHNHVRGMSPWPGAYTLYNEMRVKIWQTSIKDNKNLPQGRLGEIIAITDEGFWVQTGDLPLLISKLQPAGKKIMSAKDFVNGYGVVLGQLLGDYNE